MSDYQTPRRRHSSLFQRMENQINKISKKLSAAKQHRSGHSRKFTSALPSFNPLQDTPEQTVRRSKQVQTRSKQLTRKVNAFGDRTNYVESSSRAPVRRLRFGLDESQNHQVKKLIQENRALEQQVKMLKTVCQEQSFKVGFLRAQSRQRQTNYSREKQLNYREQIYLSKLAEGYRIKIQKYKRILGDEQSLQLSLSDL